MENQEPMELSNKNFDSQVLEADVPVLVDFWAPWCAPCHVVRPMIEDLARRHQESARVGTVNIDDEPGLAAKYEISAIPTVLVFHQGEVVERIVGARPRPDYENALKRHVVTKAA